MEKEVFKDIQGYEGRYQVSNYGRIKSLVANGKYVNEDYHFMKPNRHRDGYLKIQLKSKSKKTPKCFLIHRLVALHFVPNPDPENLREINHKDGNKENNYFENLEWCTRSYNIKHAFDTGLKVNKKGAESWHAVRFYRFDLEGKLLDKWYSIVDCAKYIDAIFPNKYSTQHVIASNISECLNGRFKTACGFIFSFNNTINLEEHKHITKPRKPVVGTHKKDGTQIFFDKVTDANGFITKDGKILQATIISKCCLGKRDSHGGYTWSYKNN